MNRRRKSIFWVVLWLPPLSAALLGLWIAGYWAIPDIPIRLSGDPLISYDAEMGYVPRPRGHTIWTQRGPNGNLALRYNVYTDARGARVTASTENTLPNADIVLIGCSMTWGHGVENPDTFAQKVTRSLGVTGLNLAMAGFGTTQSLQMLRRNRDLAPRLVVYPIIASHLQRNVSACAPSYYPFCLDTPGVVWRQGIAEIAFPRSNGVRRFQLHLKSQSGFLDPLTWLAHGVDVIYGRILWKNAQAAAADGARQDAAFEYLLEQLVRTVSEMGSKLLVVYIPASGQFPGVLSRTAEQLHIPFLDLTEAFRRHQDSRIAPALYIPNDGHLSIAGHALAAEQITKHIQDEKLLHD